MTGVQTCALPIFNELDDDRIAELLGDGPVQEVAGRLVSEAVAAGGHDNVTVLVVEVVEGPDRPLGGRPQIPEARLERATGPVRSRRVDDDPRAILRTTIGSVAAVVATAILVLSLYAQQGWFIGDDDGDVAVFRGRSGGILWFDPTFEEGGDLRGVGRRRRAHFPEGLRRGLPDPPHGVREEGRQARGFLGGILGHRRRAERRVLHCLHQADEVLLRGRAKHANPTERFRAAGTEGGGARPGHVVRWRGARRTWASSWRPGPTGRAPV